jgi:hypothetical protein
MPSTKPRLTTDQMKQALENSLRFFNFLEKYIIVKSDGRMGKLFAIGYMIENGGLVVKTSYLFYAELNHFLMGYQAKSINLFN